MKQQILVMAVGLALFAGSAIADNSNKVVIGSDCVVQFRTSSGGFTPEQRADAVQTRLNNILSDTTWTPADIHVNYVHSDASIMVGSHLFVTITAADAKASASTVRDVASR